jgi:hypothetical protein
LAIQSPVITPIKAIPPPLLRRHGKLRIPKAATKTAVTLRSNFGKMAECRKVHRRRRRRRSLLLPGQLVCRRG